MKKKFTFMMGLLLAFGMQANAQECESAKDAVKNMGVGWNLGNTLEANTTPQTVTDPNDDAYWGQQGLESENYWGQPTTTREFIKMMKNAGFTAIRVPVTWYNHMDANGNVKEEWMARVKEVVDYVLDEGLYCIINVHHDTGADGKDAEGNVTHYKWIKADKENYEQNVLRYSTLWIQIATMFQDYGEKLLFEGFNEMLDKNSCWNYPTWSNTGDYDEEAAKQAYDAINSYNETFVQSVRLTGGMNVTRNLIINDYAAACGGEWGNNKHPQEPLETFQLPNDQVENHLIVEVHFYPNITGGISSTKSGVDWSLNNLNEKLIQRLNVPLIIGEWGTSNVDTGIDYIERRDEMNVFCDYLVKKAKEYDIATFYWMGLSDGKYREQLVFNQPDLAETITKAYHGDDFEGQYPAAEIPVGGVVFEGEKQLEWGDAINILPESFAELDSNCTLEVTYKLNFTDFDEDGQYGMMQFWYNDWSEMININAEGKTFNGDFVPLDVYGGDSGPEYKTVFSFDETTFNNIKKKGLLFQGHGLIVYKAELFSDGAPQTGIKSIKADGKDAPIYNLEGQRVTNPTKGIYIKNGKKFIVK